MEPTRTTRTKEVAHRALGFVKAAPQALTHRSEVPYADVDAYIRDHLVYELHRYPRKKNYVAWGLWGLFGLVGGHRYYLGQVGLAVLMTITLGGAGIWWIIDAFSLKKMVAAFNDAQAERARTGDPPIGLEFVPKVSPNALGALPDWQQGRTKGGTFRRGMGLLADAFVVGMSGYILGVFTLEAETYNVVGAAVAVVFMINFADRLFAWHDWPGVREMIRWDYKLRLFYHFNEPGRAYTLMFRSIAALIYAPFSRKRRAEVTLYLEIAGLFAAGGILMKILSGEFFGALLSFDFEPLLSDWVRSVFFSFFAVYALAAPIGATLMKHTLLRRPNYVRWGLSFVALWFLLRGFGLV